MLRYKHPDLDKTSDPHPDEGKSCDLLHPRPGGGQRYTPAQVGVADIYPSLGMG